MGLELNLTTQPGPDGVTRIVQLHPPELYQKKRSRTINDLGSLVAYLVKWGDATKGTIYWTTNRIVVLLDEQDLLTGNGAQDRLTFSFDRPHVAKLWLAAIKGRDFSHKQFKDFLESRWQEIAGGSDLFVKISNLSIAQTFSYEGKLDDDHNYKLAIKSEAGADVASIPKVITVEIPLLEGLEKTYKLVLKLKMSLPDSKDPTPSFRFVWEDEETVFEQAARDAIATLAEQLPEWLIVHGQPSANTRDADF